jgi:hypothetical protein
MSSHQPINFAGSTLEKYRHVCVLLHNRDEEYRFLVPFIREGLDRGEKLFHVADPKLREEHVIGGVLAENPFYVPPEEFLIELCERGPGRRARGLNARAG